jgi:predicted NBD/HSP70 family sugar kinase
MNIVCDIGGTNMRLARSDDGTNFGEPIIVATPKDFDAGMQAFKDAVAALSKGEKIEALAGGIAGPLDRPRSTLLSAPNLPGWIGKPVKSALEEITGAPVYLENDTAMVGLGEAVVGAGKGANIVAYVTISTGVGGVRIVHGKIDVSAYGFEPGHQIIDAGGRLRESSVGGQGVDFEGMISGTSLTTRYGKKPYELTEDSFWDEMARLAAYGLNNTIVHWSPDVVVLGGSMMKKIGIKVERVREHLKGILHIFPEHPRIEHSELGDLGGLHGSLAYLRSRGS